MDPKLLDQLRKLFPQSAIDIGVIYAPALARMALAQVLAIIEQLRSGKTHEAMEQIRAAMTAEELAAEKKDLTPLLEAMAKDQAEAMSVVRELAMAGLAAALRIAIGMVAL